MGLGLRVRVRVRSRVRVHPGVAAAAVQGLQLLQLQIQGPIILVLSESYYSGSCRMRDTVTASAKLSQGWRGSCLFLRPESVGGGVSRFSGARSSVRTFPSGRSGTTEGSATPTDYQGTSGCTGPHTPGPDSWLPRRPRLVAATAAESLVVTHDRQRAAVPQVPHPSRRPLL